MMMRFKQSDTRAYTWYTQLTILTIILALFSNCAPTVSMKVLIQMIEAQENYFKEEVVKPFSSKERAKITVLHYNAIDSIPNELEKYKGEIGLVKVPFEKSWSLVNLDLIKPLEDFCTPEEMKEFASTYMLTSLGRKDDKQYYIPRKFETRLMVYCKSKVLDAVSTWRKYREEIQLELQKYNGYGLPATYMLEDDPNLWNFYDVFVVGWIWAHTPYNGQVGPRIAHRGKRYSGTWHRVVDRVFQCEGDSAAAVSMQGDAVIDAFQWEAVYAAGNVYNPKMWKDAWSGGGVWQGFADGEVFLSFMTQLDCFFIHGMGNEELKGYLANPDDMGVATMPAGCSVEVGQDGKLLRQGVKAITTGGWWWGIPKSTPDPVMSYKLARHITSLENQIQGCSRFGMIPVRKDVLSDMQMFFGGQWISEIYNVSFRQLMYNKFTTVPSHPRFDEIGNVYLDAWYEIVVDQNWSQEKIIPDRMYIKKILEEKYGSRISAILNN